MSDVIDHLRASAPAGIVVVAPESPVALTCDISVSQPDGSLERFRLRIRWRCGRLIVWERGGRLPKACPERHINGDGSFCLRWPQTTPGSLEEADTWWKELRGFLTAQLWANHTAKWPVSKSWAHGDAARHQREFERLASTLPPPLVDKLVAEWRRGEDRSRRRLCPCGLGVRFKDCHESVAETLARSLDAWQAAEELFWRGCRHPCCETMFGCRLRGAAS